MPNDDKPKKSTLNPELFAKLAEHVRSKWTKGCPMCDARQWTLGGTTIIPTRDNFAFEAGMFVNGGSASPMVILVCNKCGNIAFLAAKQIGLFVEADEAKP